MTLPRKQPASAIKLRQGDRLPLPPVRRRIWEEACDLVAVGDQREISIVLANRFHTSPRIISLVLVSEGMKHERVASSLRTGILNALEVAREAGGAHIYPGEDLQTGVG